MSYFEKEPGFDRLFPNQDFYSVHGLGNLTALPFNIKAIQNGKQRIPNFIRLTIEYQTPFAYKRYKKLPRQ